MVNLTIRLNAKGSGGETTTPTKTAVEGPGTPKLVCGGHLIQAELPTASGLGLISDLAAATTPSSGYLGYRVRRTAGDKVHFCVRCHFPIAIYGRLDPCEHVFCLICAKKDINCFLCDERILRIQKLEVLEGIFVCGAAGCLRSFLAKSEFEWHIREVHSHLLCSREAPRERESKLLLEAPHPNQSSGQNQNAPSPSPSHSQPHSPSQSRQVEPPNFGSNPNLSLPEASPAPEKIVKQHSNSSGPSGDHPEPPSKRKKLELQLNVGLREREREKGRARDDHGKGHDDREREDGHKVREREHSQKDREHTHRKRDRSNQERDRDREKDRDNRDQEREFQNQFQREREQWEQQQLHQQQQHQQQQGPGPHYQLPPPPPPPPPPPLQPNAHQPERLVQGPLAQQGAAPSSFPPQGFPPYHVQQQQENRNTPRFESPRHGPFMDPRMTVPPDYQETSARARHLQQDGERARNMPPQQQEGYRPPMDNRQAIMVPRYHGEFGGPMGMPMGPPSMQGMVRFQEGAHGGGHLPLPKRGNFGPSGESAMAHPAHAFGWGGPANFAGAPSHPPFMNWQPPQ